MRLIGWLAGTRFSGLTKVSIVACGRSCPRILLHLTALHSIQPQPHVDRAAGGFFNRLLARSDTVDTAIIDRWANYLSKRRFKQEASVK
jgi:hypothetical protein